MEDLKVANPDTLAVIAYHSGDDYVDSANSFDARYRYYRGTSGGIPLSIIDGDAQLSGGIAGGNLYNHFLPLFNQAAARVPNVDISISFEGSDRVIVGVTNTSWSGIQGTLHIALVERHRQQAWKDMKTLDFICRSMFPSPYGQTISIAPSQTYESVQQFNIRPDWNYCSIVAFFQTADKKIVQAAMINIEDSIPEIHMLGVPESGDLWLKGSTHSFSWTANRQIPSVVYEYSTDGGSTWTEFQPTSTGNNSYSWTLPNVHSTQCLLSVRDSHGVRATSGLFAIGVQGDFNSDGTVGAADRILLIEHLTETKSALLPGMDLNGDGAVDLFDLIYFDAAFR